MAGLERSEVFIHDAILEGKAADALAEALDLHGLRLRKSLIPKAARLIDDPVALRDLLEAEALKTAGRVAPALGEFIYRSIGPFEDFAEPDYAIVGGAARDIAIEIAASRNALVAEKMGGALSRYVLDQADRTQDRSVYRFVRRAEANACKWCQAQVLEYETTRRMVRHQNCKCTKVRR